MKMILFTQHSDLLDGQINSCLYRDISKVFSDFSYSTVLHCLIHISANVLSGVLISLETIVVLIHRYDNKTISDELISVCFFGVCYILYVPSGSLQIKSEGLETARKDPHCV